MAEKPQPKRRRGRPTVPILLSDDERQALERWARQRTSSQALALRSRIVLACAEGLSNVEAGKRLGVHPATVGKWRGRFAQRRLAGLVDEPRPGAPRTITDEQVAEVITTTMEAAPTDATHWSTRAMARATGMSQTAISRIWRASGLKPHLDAAWKLSMDPRFIDKVRDVVGLYLNPPEAVVVLCVDDSSQSQAPDRTAPVPPLPPGVAERRGNDDTRHGTTSLHAALKAAGGKVISQTTPGQRAREFKRFLARIDQAVPAELDMHVICDDSPTYKTPAIQRWLLAHPHFHLHFTPTQSSWSNLVERWFARLTNQWPERGTHGSVAELTGSIRSWIDTWNGDPRPFVWVKTTDQILENSSRSLQRISNSGHSSLGRRSKGESAALGRKRERKTAILKAALEALREKGLAETRMIDIARRVHMSPGHVLYYFPSKRALLMEALEWSEETFHQRAAEELPRAATAWDRLLRLMDLSAPMGEGDPQWLLWLETWANAPHDEEVARHQAGLGRRWIAQIVEVVREGQERGEFSPIPAHLFALRLTALMDGLAVMVVTGAGQTSRRRMLEETRLWAAEQLGVQAAVSLGPPLD
jgi:AcrR family transcriptional regulator/transposase